MKIENVIKKFNSEEIYSCPKCLSESRIENISLVCGNNHRYDFSKKGYIHLINNYKPTKYNEELFKARGEIFSNDFYVNVLKNIQNLIEKYAKEVVLDIGCGEGYYIRKLKTAFPEKYFYGLDNSKDAIEIAVKEDKLNPYMVANLANLPFRDNSVSCILNILTPANYEEFFRVLGDAGYLIKVIPNARYLREIRELIGGKEYTNSDTVSLIEENCTIVERVTVRDTFRLDKVQAENFLKMTPLTFSKNITAVDVDSLKEITIDLEILVCKK
ncbi:methyltransferase domain-containing protein [Gemella parahaemolysans]|jgi:methyltransferase domain protein